MGEQFFRSSEAKRAGGGEEGETCEVVNIPVVVYGGRHNTRAHYLRAHVCSFFRGLNECGGSCEAAELDRGQQQQQREEEEEEDESVEPRLVAAAAASPGSPCGLEG